MTAVPASAAVLEEVTVTAQKREESMQDIGISVTAFSGDQMKALGIENAADLVVHTPGLNAVSPFGAGSNVAFTLRGVGLNDFSESNEAPVAVYVDGVYNATLAGIGFQLFDIERAEVLRGPQGTLYGRNSTGGLVHFITRKPTPEKEASVELTLSEYDQVRVEGNASGGLTDRLWARASILYNKHDGYIENTNPGVADAGETDNISGRVQFLYQQSDDLEFLFKVHAGESDQVGAAYKHTASMVGEDGFDSVEVPADVDIYGTCAGCDLTGYRDTTGDFYKTENNREPFVKLDTFGSSLNIDWTVGDFDITSITAYEDVEKQFGEDTDSGPAPFIEVTNPVDSEQWSQEFQIQKSAERSRWTAGMYYYMRDINSGTRTDLSRETFIGFPANNNTVTQDETDSWSLFGQYEYDITANTTIIAGLRYTDEEREFDMVVTDENGILPDPAFAFTEATAGGLTKHDTDNLTYRLEINHHFHDDLLVFASTAKGVKGAGFNIDLGIDPRTVEDIPFDEEELFSYELGFKWTLLNGAVRFNSSVFYYDYKDYQAFSFEGLSNVVSNKDASIYGLDAELVASPWEGWDFNIGLSLLDTEVEDINTGVSVIDRELAMAPEATFNALARYEWEAMNGVMSVQGDMQYVGEQYFDITNTTLGTEDSYSVGNLRASYLTASGKTQFSVWVKNVTDEEYRIYAIQVPGLGFSQSMIGQPRWAGVTISHNW
ncbi:TonB-dependent receptor [Kineobactrum salinum]|uniref:TonB-dependent receptor n=1 Tax=Kineobactrum salinum TaxID=2708301 RepID=A0A6C0U680_9GAMM|nr:TonB-dependent receptor [Kineobactrum salinum]QIB64944.1 TonB-dependent receptor [Kineobactrum salinum]